MKASFSRYVRHADVPAYLTCGWVARPVLEGTHHGARAVLCEWLCDCPLIEPDRLKATVAYITHPATGVFILNIGQGNHDVDRIEISSGQLANIIKDGTQALMDQRGWS